MNSYWFGDVGDTIIKIMWSNMYWPIIEYFIDLGISILFRRYDQWTLKWSVSPTKTSCVSIQQYLDIYSGPDFSSHYKYSYILVVVFVTFSFGSGLPILFPIAFMSILNLYVIERLMMAYSYNRPAMLGTATNKACMKAMLTAPILYCVAASWIFSIKQVFLNDVTVNKSAEYLFPTIDHTPKDLFKYLTPGNIFFYWLLILAVHNYGPLLADKISLCFTGEKLFYKKDEIDAMKPMCEPFSDSLTKK